MKLQPERPNANKILAVPITVRGTLREVTEHWLARDALMELLLGRADVLDEMARWAEATLVADVCREIEAARTSEEKERLTALVRKLLPAAAPLALSYVRRTNLDGVQQPWRWLVDDLVYAYGFGILSGIDGLQAQIITGIQAPTLSGPAVTVPPDPQGMTRPAYLLALDKHHQDEREAVQNGAYGDVGVSVSLATKDAIRRQVGVLVTNVLDGLSLYQITKADNRSVNSRSDTGKAIKLARKTLSRGDLRT